MASQVSFSKRENGIAVNFTKSTGEKKFIGIILKGKSEYFFTTYDIPPQLNSAELKDIAQVIDECNEGKHF